MQSLQSVCADQRQHHPNSNGQSRDDRIRNRECCVTRRLATWANVVYVHLFRVVVSASAASQTAVGTSRTGLVRCRNVVRVVRRAHHAGNTDGDVQRNRHSQFRHLESQHHFASHCAVTGRSVNARDIEGSRRFRPDRRRHKECAREKRLKAASLLTFVPPGLKP